MKQLTIGILIGVAIIVSIAAIRPSKEQVVLTYHRSASYKIKNDLERLFKSGYKVVSMLSYDQDYRHSDGTVIIIMEK